MFLVLSFCGWIEQGHPPALPAAPGHQKGSLGHPATKFWVLCGYKENVTCTDHGRSTLVTECSSALMGSPTCDFQRLGSSLEMANDVNYTGHWPLGDRRTLA